MAKPLSLAGSGRWYGNDGSWTGFSVQVGTPPQTFEVFPSFQSQNVWLPIDEECLRIQADAGACGSSRGAAPFQQSPSPGFQPNMSSSWQAINLFELGLEKVRGITGNGFVGFDNVQVGNISLDKFPVTAYASPGFWVGQLGLLPLSINYSTTVNSPSFLVALRDGGHIPSVAYGYQAGSPYRGTKVPASLVLGGYDGSRASKPLTVKINTDMSRALTVSIHDIVATGTLNGTLSLVNSERILAPLDSSIPELWLPKSVCDRFESVFGLEYHEASGRYLLTDAKRDQLRSMNPIVTMTIGSDPSISGNSTIIQLPYAAFDLQAGFPIFVNETNYFPIRRADNESQYAIGRVFLQEAYIGVDFESGTFNVSAARWDELDPEIITILSEESKATAEKTGDLPSGAIAGIVVGCVVGIALVIACAWLMVRKRKRKNIIQHDAVETGANEKIRYEMQPPSELESNTLKISELPGKQGDSELYESRAVPELGSRDCIYEMSAGPVPGLPAKYDEGADQNEADERKQERRDQ
ncbi:hypothetical protein COCSADRAFT_35932 [Bipolaris sorokiniana ND90Pr]|uniref:Peptidase A1 domain-containing protein n=1 Tax=Cochliobolus sativus (strain ND90Pr / ATCC 201652) TaxID=665912 RepID=M2T9U3_COCSN|nr:uncharacterized protein COCSADRAFT_35932 [Bipolaris sorokiniana ND90Pr]EMD66001.1 hypothetical protein COCSADRAFT_35932 [Bipolaris sorokiniana ND90Pr]